MHIYTYSSFIKSLLQMTDYFGEHDAEELPDLPPWVQQLPEEQRRDPWLYLARIIAGGGEPGFDFFGNNEAPPTSKKFLEESLNEKLIRNEEDEFDCPVCLKTCEQDEVSCRLPCKHSFHKDCILPWLKRTNSCPMCRHELPTDNPAYEEQRKYKARAKQREQDIENLHNSMFG